MSTYLCEPCMKSFNGIIPYKCHLASEKHKKKINNQPSVQDLRDCNFVSSNWEQEPFIICIGNGYKCTLCQTFLNSVDQVKGHIHGGKHLKAKASLGFTNSNVLSLQNRSMDQVDGSPSSTALTFDSRFQFYIHDYSAKELIENMEVFKPDDEIAFNTIKASAKNEVAL